MTQMMPLYVLADGAQFPAAVVQLIRQAPEYRNVYAGMPEESAGDAALFLARIGDGHPAWMAGLDALDQKMPCLSLILSDTGIDALATHFQQFLVADLGDRMSTLMRYFDPRNLAAFLRILGPEIAGKLTAPLYQWKYRGHSRDWQGIKGGAQYTAILDSPVSIKLEQSQLDALIAHCEPDQILFSLIERGVVDGSGPYMARFEDFLPRYRKVAAWGIREPMCRLRYCELSYQHGLAFDQHPEVRAALEARWQSGDALFDHIDALPAYVWEGIRAARGDVVRREETEGGSV